MRPPLFGVNKCMLLGGESDPLVVNSSDLLLLVEKLNFKLHGLELYSYVKLLAMLLWPVNQDRDPSAT